QDAGGRFAINGLNQIVAADGSLLNFEAASSHTVTVRVTDQDGLSFDEIITLHLTNVAGTFTGSSDNDLLNGSAEEDSILGLEGNDTLMGGAGDDRIAGGDGDDLLYGGSSSGDSGIDTLDYSLATAAVSLDLATNAPQVTGGAGIDAVSGFEILVGSSYSDVLLGSMGAETIQGGAGNDSIDGRGGQDLLLGGEGDDRIVVDAAALASGGALIDGGADFDMLVLAGGPALALGQDLVGKVTNIEQIDATGTGSVLDLRNISGEDLRSILGLPALGGSGTLTVRLDGDDFDVTAAAGQFTSFDAGTNTTAFFTDSSMTTEMAKVQVV
ncbi:MAG: hypothetical protein IOC90_07540, partial [Methylocystis sp.]|nr:hypothetical protein [Methylocystis sp.]